MIGSKIGSYRIMCADVHAYYRVVKIIRSAASQGVGRTLGVFPTACRKPASAIPVVVVDKTVSSIFHPKDH